MIFYGIKDRRKGRIWSRNNWNDTVAVPDMYMTHKAAMRQINTGKIAVHEHFQPGEYEPYVCLYRLTDVTAGKDT